MLSFGLNQVTMARAPIRALIEAAAGLGMIGVELRNDLGRPVFDGLPAAEVRQLLQDHGLRLLGLSQVSAFNHWSSDTSDEVEALAALATEAGAETISLIPSNDGRGYDPSMRHEELARALEGCLPLLEAADLVALVEPLGFAGASLRDKGELLAVISALGGQHRFRVVHDTFHHTLAEDEMIAPENIGIVHISGGKVPTVPIAQMEDMHRVLVDADDRLGNLEQIGSLRRAGYCGVYSFECFSPLVHEIDPLEDAIRTSMNFISSHMQGDIAA